ncbi:MAG: asparaginase [Rhizobacter sp.]
MQNKIIVVLGTGGTIAGQACSSEDNTGYKAGQISVADLVAAIPALHSLPLEFEQIAQLDSKDMDHATWQRLAQRAATHLARAEVGALVITHGTDTLEETAYFLHRVLAPTKPVVMTAAMRPATSRQADGPQNLVDAIVSAQTTGAAGVTVVMAGRVHSAIDVFKAHPYQLDAFSPGESGPVALIEEGQVRQLRPWPVGQAALGWSALSVDPAAWPQVEVLISHAGSDARIVQALLSAGAAGLVVAGCGNGNVHARLEVALLQAQALGVPVWRSTRCLMGSVVHRPSSACESDPLSLHATPLSPIKARVELMLFLMTDKPDRVRL